MKRKIFPIVLIISCILGGCSDDTKKLQKMEESIEIKEKEITLESQSVQTTSEEHLDIITEKNQREKLLEQYNCIRAEQKNYSGEELTQTQSIYMDRQKIMQYDMQFFDPESQKLVSAQGTKKLYALGNLYCYDENADITKIDGDEDIERARSSAEKYFGISKCANRKVEKNEEVDGMLHIQISVPMEDYYPDEAGYDYQELRAMNVREVYWDYYVDKDTYLLKQSTRTIYNGPSGCNESVTFYYEYGGERIELPEELPQ